MKILAIESSCDETACALVENGTHVIASSVASSSLMHQKYGGIVPEIAARKQVEYILPVIHDVLGSISNDQQFNLRTLIQKNIDAIAVSIGPGLNGSLVIGIEAAKTLAFVTEKPIIPVNHVLAHMYANFVGKDTNIEFPAISLVVSGGHTELFLMTSPRELQWLGGTQDDAAGEAFDKTARLLGFGSGGGPAIQQAAEAFDFRQSKFKLSLPRPLLHDTTLNFSFSGLKTAVAREWSKVNNKDAEIISHFAYEIQESITDVLVAKTLKASEQYHAKSILVAGGVAANSRLREKFSSEIRNSVFDTQLCIPPVSLCTDNAVYIASYAYFRGEPKPWQTLVSVPDLSVEV